MNLEGKKITIIGCGKSGKAVVELVLKLNGIPKITDNSAKKKLDKDIKEWVLKDKVDFELGRHTRKFVEDSHMVVVSPGIRIDSEPVQWAKEKNIPTLGEIEFAWRLCKGCVVAVTGSNGKTTVATLIKEVLDSAGKPAHLCGNIGNPFSGCVMDVKKGDTVVLEISSFQLESIVDFHPYIAVMLNISQNHLDRHKDLDEYISTKKKIFMNQADKDFAVINYDQPIFKDIVKEINSQVSYFNEPQKKKGMWTDDPNFLAVIEVTRILGINKDICRNVFNSFKGVEHRLEMVRSIDEVDFINDSKSTTGEAGRWALERISKPIIMICGGRDKNIDYTPLKKLVNEKVKTMIVIGEAKNKLMSTFASVVKVEQADGLKDAVLKAKDCASKGDAVVLSPMCASFDMFPNFEHRGKIFKQIVSEL